MGDRDMSAVIYKYPLGEYPGITQMAMPAGARIVHVGEQYGCVTVWAIVDRGAPLKVRHLNVVATGEDFDGEYVSTAQMSTGLVWHVVDLGESEAVR
jgi:hypothetical protein